MIPSVVNNIKRYWIVIVIFLLGLFLRTYNLSEMPAGLHGDEVSVGYNAYSLLKTAHDQNGNFLPLSIDQFGDFRPAGYHYLDIPFVSYLGLTALAVRLPAALFGAFTIIAFYFLLQEIFKRRAVSLVGALLIAILPWHVNISRATSESVIAGFFVICGIIFFLKALQQERRRYLQFLFSTILFSISFLFYHSARFFVPLFLPFTFFLIFSLSKQKRVRVLLSAVVVFCVLMGALLFLFGSSHAGARPLDVSILNIPGGDRQLTQQIGEDGTQNPVITRLFHNKLFFYGQLFLTFYSEHYSGDFLFVNTGNPIRYRIPWTGNLYLSMAPFLLLGFVFLTNGLFKEKKIMYIIPLAWLLIGGIPAGLTWEDLPNVQRASLLIPAFVMITSFGFIEVVDLVKVKGKYVIIFLSVVLLVHNFAYFAHNYFHHGEIHEPWYRSAGEKELFFQVSLHDKNVDQVVMTQDNNNNLIFNLFYNAFDPATFQKMGSPKEKDKLRFGNILYLSSHCPLDPSGGDTAQYRHSLIVEDAGCVLPLNADVVTIIRTPDGAPSFQLVTLNDKVIKGTK